MRAFLTGLVLVTLCRGEILAAESPSIATTISIDGMHCQGCAKKVTGKLKSVAFVKFADVDAATGVAKVTPQAGSSVSPKALWEAVVNAGYKPTKLVGPSGTFTKKPDA